MGKHTNVKKVEDEPEKPTRKVYNAKELEAIKTPLKEATSFLKPLQELLSDKIETHIAAFEISYRKEKPLLMLQSLKRGLAINKEHPKILKNILHTLKVKNNPTLFKAF